MKELFIGNISKETADMIKEMEASGGPLSTCQLNLVSVIVLTNSDISSYLPESTDEPIEPQEMTSLLGEAFKNMVDDDVDFFYYDNVGGSMALADVQIVYEEGTSNIIGISFDSTILDDPIVWSATGDTVYGADSLTFGNNPECSLFSWSTRGE